MYDELPGLSAPMPNLRDVASKKRPSGPPRGPEDVRALERIKVKTIQFFLEEYLRQCRKRFPEQIVR